METVNQSSLEYGQQRESSHIVSDNTEQAQEQQAGKVYLIGAGPGDPDLITVKGLRYLRTADIILYDRLISPDLLHEARAEAELVYVGKDSGYHIMPQDQINATIINYARQGKTVARLKGGDPFVFGRGGEEAQALYEAGIPFEIVPGITSAIAVPAYAGIPVTHRDYTTSFTVVTGHESRSSSPTVDWQALAALGGTIIVLMGLKALPDFTRNLIKGGMAASTPAAVIQQGTTTQQRVVYSTVADIAERALQAGLTAPVLTVIGSVVNLSETLDWFHKNHTQTPSSITVH